MSFVFAIAEYLIESLLQALAQHQTKVNRNYNTLEEIIETRKITKKRVAIIGSGISGIQAMKSCLEAGIDFVCLEADSDVGGFWRYKEDINERSVYKSTHIDTDRDMNSYSDNPMSENQPLFLSNALLFDYLRQNCDKYNLWEKIQFNTRVDFVTVQDKQATEGHVWLVRWTKVDPVSKEVVKTGESYFDGVMVCTGRHGHGGWIPSFTGLDTFKKPYIHSSQYKYPEKHEIQGKNVLVVGVGNSGIDIVTEVCQSAANTFLLARSGSWIIKADHGEQEFSRLVLDRFSAYLLGKLPWWVTSFLMEKSFQKSQSILNKHGLKPQHRFMQQHLLVSGLTDPDHTLHEELEKGNIKTKKSIQRFTEDGVLFDDDDTATTIDFVIFATGFKQGVSFIDPEIVDMSYNREGNEVLLYKHMFPLHNNRYSSLAFINFLQTATFMAADLQSRFFVQVLKGERELPSIDDQRKEVYAIRNALCAQYMDRQQLRVQGGLSMKYYDDLAECIGCYPSLRKLVRERPTAIWHAWFTPWQPIQYRLVGTGRLEIAERAIEQLYESRFYGVCPRTGKKRCGPKNRGGWKGFMISAMTTGTLSILLIWWWMKGSNFGDKLEDKLEENLQYAKKDPIPHASPIS